MAGRSLALCDPGGELTSLAVAGVGTAYFAQFESNPATGTARLYGGVCVEGSHGEWTLRTGEANVANLRGPGPVEADLGETILVLNDWEIVASKVHISGENVLLDDVRFNGEGLSGSAATLDVASDGSRPAVATALTLRGRNLSLDAAEGRLEGEEIHLALLQVSTCNCPGEPFYRLTGVSGRLSLAGPRLVLAGGQLEVGPLTVPLANGFEVSPESIARLSLPLAVEYRPPPAGGFGVMIPSLALAPNLSLEAGVVGVAGDAPARGVLLTHYRGPEATFSVGVGRDGPRAEFTASRPVPGGTVTFSVRNLPQRSFDYLHDGSLTFTTGAQRIEIASNTALNLSAAAFVAASSQTIGGATVASARVGTSAGAGLSHSTDRLGSFEVAASARFTAYPDLARSQYGVILHGTWRYSAAPVDVTVVFDRTWTDSGSPFSVRLDRLSPRSRLVVSGGVRGPLQGGFTGRMALDFEYDLLRLAASGHGGLDRLALSGGIGQALESGWQLDLTARVELAGALDPDPARRRQGSASISLGASKDDYEAGLAVVYGLRHDAYGLSALELSGAMPIPFQSGVVTPFLALDFAPVVLGAGGPVVSGHGLTLTWHSCCGTLRLGYRQEGDTLSTELGVEIVN